MPTPPPIDSTSAIERTIREDWGRILAALTRSLGDLQLAEDCLQDAVERAMVHWGRNGLPRSPAAWLLTTARRRAIDQLRRGASFRAKARDIAYLQELDAMDSAEDGLAHIPDKRLEMVFTCCHPALEEKSRVALTLRTLGGLTTEEIAAAFLDKPATMGQRLSRAKAKIAGAGIPYKVPGPADLPERLSGVMRVIYLIFNEGYRASSGPDMLRPDLSSEAIRLARIILGLMPGETELKGLLALMLLGTARAAARTGADGAFVPLEAQNRARWDRALMAEAVGLLQGLPLDGPYQLQAAISACHGTSPSWAATDWPRIAALYARLEALEPNPVVRLNRAVALVFADDLEAADALITDIAETAGIDSYQPFFAARAELRQRQGDLKAARADLDRAITLTQSDSERAFLQAKRTSL